MSTAFQPTVLCGRGPVGIDRECNLLTLCCRDVLASIRPVVLPQASEDRSGPFGGFGRGALKMDIVEHGDVRAAQVVAAARDPGCDDEGVVCVGDSA